jgi:hypothetical protein
MERDQFHFEFDAMPSYFCDRKSPDISFAWSKRTDFFDQAIEDGFGGR